MVSIEWCLKQKNGIEIVNPNKNIPESYIRMAEESINILQKVSDSNIWTATTSYYIYYYSLYALMLRIGIKCEIHNCSIEIMRKCLNVFYTQEDINDFEDAFKCRIDLQYYSNRPVDKKAIDYSKKNCKIFFIKTKTILSTIREDQINSIRNGLII